MKLKTKLTVSGYFSRLSSSYKYIQKCQSIFLIMHESLILKKKTCWYIIICKIDLASLKWNVDNLNIEEPKMFLII